VFLNLSYSLRALLLKGAEIKNDNDNVKARINSHSFSVQPSYTPMLATINPNSL